MNSIIYKVTIKCLSPINIGTGAINKGYIKEMTIKDSNLNPYIPGSTIKGLLRDNFRKIENDETVINYLFGNKNQGSRIIVEDMKLKSDYKSVVRFGNAIDRSRKVVMDNALYSKETVSGEFQGYIQLLDNSSNYVENLNLAIKMISSIGSGKSSGFGKVSVSAEIYLPEEEKKLIVDESNRFLLKFQSPVLVGGKQKTANYMESDDIIKGNVIRAAFAKIILDQCPLKNETVKVNGEDRYNWVSYRNKPCCKECNFRKTCSNFDNMKFSYFYPLGSEVIPLCVKVCKKDNDHRYYNDLIHKEKKPCTKCHSKLEFTTGLRKKYGDKGHYELGKTFLTRNAINSYTKTSQDGMLYSVQVVSNTPIDNELYGDILKEDQDNECKIVYEGKIEGLCKEEFKNFNVLRVGGDITAGFGKCILQSVEDEKKEDSNSIKNHMKKFSNLYKKGDLNFVAIKFTSDCMLDFNYDGKYKDTGDLKKIWRDALLNNYKMNKDAIVKKVCNLEVEKVYSETSFYRGYNHSLDLNIKRSEVSTLVNKGTVILFRSEDDIDDIYNFLNSIEGFGDETKNGFGAFEIYYEEGINQ